MNKVGNPLFPRLALIILLFLGMVSVEVMNPATAEAIWLGKNGYIYGGSGDACDSWANFYGTWIQRMVPGYNSSGDTFNYTCYIRNPINAGNDINVPTYPQCQSGETINGQVKRGCTKPTPEKEKGDCSDCPKQGARKTKHPITISNGNKFLKVTDFETVGPSPLRWTRYYNSMARKESSMGIGWRHNYSGRLWLSSSTVTIAYRPDGSAAVFTLTGGTWTTDPDIPQQLVKQGSQWLLTTTNDSVETYDSTGKLLSIVSRDGYQQTLNYNASNQLESVTDSYGRQVTFTYNSLRLETMTDPDGGVYTYAYDKTISHLVEPNLLVKVSYPDDTPGITTDNPTVTYLYEDEEYPYAVTGILDEHNVRFLTYGYDTDGRATFSELANGAERTDLVYHVDDRTTVTNALGQSIIYHFDWIHGSRKVTQEERLATATVPAANAYWTYDINGYLASTTDWNGNITTFIHNSRGLQTSRTEASATSEARTITTTWHATFRVPTQIQEPEKTTDFTYDTNGFLLTRTETDTTGGTTNGQTRTWTYTYTTSGQLQTVNGPRTVVTDLTTNTYTTEGFLKTVTNALGHVTDITSHSSRGLPLIVKDANNVETHLTYHPRGWLTSTTVKSNQGDVVTSFAYDDVGQLTQITRPDSSVLNYEYDNAHRVVAVTNNLGERIEYTLDAAGNRTAETVKSSASTITRSQSRTFDTLSRLLTQVGAGTQTTTTAYDANGNAITLTDPLQHATTQAFDALNRLIKVTDAKSGEAEYTYDGQDNLTTVDDQRDLTTTYVYNGFGDVIQMTSPDTGTTTYQTDSAGNRTQQTDARGVVTNYTYDALNRVATMHFPGNTAENVTYTYDSITGGNIGKGRLTSLTDQSGTTTFVYDDRGNVVTETRIINTQTYTTTYAYNLADNLLQVTYPSGRVVTYQRDTLGRVVAVTTQISSSGAPVLLANNITYHPFGPITSLTYGNGLGLTLTYDQDYRLTGIRTADGATVIQDLDYGYDNADNITTITDVLNTARNQTLGYDELHRLTSATGLYGTLGYTYDAVGNRLTRTAGVNTDTYTYATTSNQLLSILSGSNTRPFTYTTNGQINGDNRGTGENYGLSYNHQNRLNQITKNSTPTTDYLHNALGQRVVKDDLNSTTDAHYHYDRDGRLLAESDIQGVMTKEYIHLDGLPLAVIDTGSTGSGPILDLILDNSDTEVTTNGTWTTATEGTGYEGTEYLEHSQSGVPPGGELIDNESTGFSTVGTWPAATGGTGYEGSNYLVRDPNAVPADIIVDNADAAFSTTGSWTASTNIPGYYASNYLWHHPYQFSPDSITLDNGGTGFSSTGTWTLSTNIAGYQGANYQWYPALGIGGNQQLLDNGGPEFSATGQWTLSTGVPGYQGANYQWHPLAGVVLPPSSIIIDNTDAQTSSVGDWYPATNVTGYWGTNYGWHDGAQIGSSFTWTPTIPATTQYKVYARWQAWSSRATNATYTIHHAGGSTNVVQNHKLNGSQWNLLGTFTMSPSSNHRLVLSGEGNGSLTSDAVAFVDVDAIPHLATWMPTITTSQEYEVYATWQAWTGRATDATYMIHHAGGTSHVVVDQTVNGSQWNYLGTYTMEPNEDHRIDLRTDANGTVIADGVLVTPVGTPVGSATWTPPLTTTDQYAVYATWQAYAGRATDALYTIHHAGGSTPVAVDQTVNGNQWQLLGNFTMSQGNNHRVVLTESITGTIIADGVKFVPLNGARNTATWSPTIVLADDYDLFATWQADFDRATDATYTVHHANGSSNAVTNHQLNGSQFNLLGTYSFLPNTNHRIELTDAANGTVIADALKLVPATMNRVATWTPTIGTTDDYDVFVKWVADPLHATNATYTVHHAGGSTPVVINQQQNGGQWTLLGTFNMSPSSGHRIELAGLGNGVVTADAVYVVPNGTTPNRVTWTPTLIASDTVDIFAKWMAETDRSDAVTYTVYHDGGSTDVTVNQQLNGAIWHYLGEFAMTPASNHRVEVTDSNKGVVAADAVRFVSVTGSSAGLMYVHADHLGTPQKMTDGSQALVWDAVYQPFGEVQSMTGTATNNQRFPGQYADAESGYSYNYFRDYDSSTGRYVESDPIGLGGGLNTYGYVGSNPLRFIDPFGLDTWAGTQGTGGAHAGPGGIFGGAGVMINLHTGESCSFAVICGRVGLGLFLGGGVTFSSSFFSSHCGKDASGINVELAGDIAAPGSPGVGGSIGVGVNTTDGQVSGGNVGIGGRPSFGAGISVGIDICYLKVGPCTNTPKDCEECQ